MNKYLPLIDNSQRAVICKSWNFYSDLKIIKSVHSDTFDSYHSAEIFLLNVYDT